MIPAQIVARYRELINQKRTEKSTSPRSDTLDGAAASDRSRILFSAPFRRLQMKAQVFPLEDNAAVRSRLTHSLEVADIGRAIARKIVSGPAAEGFDDELKSAFVDIVETACLMHDIGNPPFGHFGELAIQRWFREKGGLAYKTATGADDWAELCQREAADFLNFDGNPQGFRIVSKFQYGVQPGMNLLYSQLLAGMKYPFVASEVNTTTKKKAGYFSTEENLLQEIRGFLSVRANCRYPLSYIMEAADDIAYCVSDLEDGFEKNLIRLDEIGTFLDVEWKETAFHKLIPKKWGDTHQEQVTEFLRFRTKFARGMIDAAKDRYEEHHDAILNGTLAELFPDTGSERKVLKALKDLARDKLFRHETVENLELAGFSVISGLLDHHRDLLELSRERFNLLCIKKWTKNRLDVEARLFNRLPKKHVYVYENALKEGLTPTQEWILRAHLITDYISGMTDQFAVSTFQKLSGVNVG